MGSRRRKRLLHVKTVVLLVAVWPEGALCDPAKMVFTDPS